MACATIIHLKSLLSFSLDSTSWKVSLYVKSAVKEFEDRVRKEKNVNFENIDLPLPADDL